jgi:hypothetical protein
MPVSIPLQEVCVFRLPRETRPHHDGLEALSVDGPELAVSCSGNRRCPLAVVKNRELTQHFAVLQSAKILTVSRYLDLPL